MTRIPEPAHWWEFPALPADWTREGTAAAVITAARGQSAAPSLKVACPTCNGHGEYRHCDDCADGHGYIPLWQYDPALTGIEPNDPRADQL